MAGQAQQGGQADNSMGFLWIIIGLFAATLLVWYLFHDAIVTYYLKFKLLELGFIGLFTSSYDALAQGVSLIVHNNPGAVTFTQIMDISTKVGTAFRIPVAIILGGFALVLYKTSAKTRHRTVFSMKTLMKQEKENWPQITPISEIDLINEDIDKGKWAMAMTPMQFAKKYKLLKEEYKEPKEGELTKEKKIEVTVVRSKANAVFSRQMGRPWSSHKDLKIYEKALFAIFAAKAVGDRDSASQLLRQIAASSASGKLDFSGAEALLEKHINDKLAQKVLSNHAFVLTVMASMLDVARTDGVLASAEFLWLKPVDRSLWYMLNTIGRQVAPAEISGPFAHWLAEKEMGRKLTVPMLEEATNALQASIAEMIYIPDED